MRYDIHYDLITDSYDVRLSVCGCYEGRYRETTYDDGYSWTEYGANEAQVRALGLELPEE